MSEASMHRAIRQLRFFYRAHVGVMHVLVMHDSHAPKDIPRNRNANMLDRVQKKLDHHTVNAGMKLNAQTSHLQLMP